MEANDTAAELERLRAEVALLRAAEETRTRDVGDRARRAASDARDAASDARDAATEAAGDAREALSVLVGEENLDKAKEQLEELGALVEASMKERPLVTGLVLFLLGLLVGRALR